MLGYEPHAGEQAVTTEEEQLRQHVATVTALPTAEVTIRVHTGTPFVEIIRHARQEVADLRP
jgi:hypothetical protein